MSLIRCSWAGEDPMMRAYHDEEWGVPEYDSRALWEKLILDGFQAGLSWSTILRKREAFRRAFLNFDPGKIAAFTATDIERLLADPSIIRSRSKIQASIGNARAFLAIPDFSAFVWSFSGGQPIRNRWQDRSEVPTQTPHSQAMSKALKQAGFKFVGPVIVYAWMQAIGMVDDHVTTCFRHGVLHAR
jgi:DNA-3-methyladenine glycosylase I